MKLRDVLCVLIGAIGGAVATYIVMEGIHEQEINDIYEELHIVHTDLGEAEDSLVELEDRLITYDPNIAVHTDEEHMDELEATTMRELYLVEQEETVELTDGGDIAEEDDPEDDDPESEEDEEMLSVNAFDGIFQIPNEEVSGRQIVGEYNHEDHSLRISKLLSVKSEMFDEVIDDDSLFPLIGEETYMLLMNSKPTTKKRLISVRNNLINLDFVISY